ncbi:universal stress protein [Rhizomonospora bruguierae]|uniref:universal stress protein n=1 Tax=Rhizomonospora bruguierae TaxID=1581705 RepID=UPI001BCB4AEE|nr:universal stress protein [Micromonospora sp. NBRC 107566]
MGRIVAVGWGGAHAGTALAWALAEAARPGNRLLLCHACPPSSPLAAAGTSPPTALLELSDPPLARAVAGARTRLGANRVDLLVRPCSPRSVLLEGAQAADLLILGEPGGNGALTRDLTARAPCAVLVARPTRGPAGPFAGRLVVGLDGSAPARAALEFAFEHADAYRCGLAAVHVEPARAVDATADGTPPDAAGFEPLVEEVAPWTHKYPEVPVAYGLFAGRPLPGLLRATAGARLLLLGDHTRGPVARALLGSVSAGAVRRAPCATAVARDWERRH